MGKTKTAFVGGNVNEKLSSEEKYKQKLAKRKAEEMAASKNVAKETSNDKDKNDTKPAPEVIKKNANLTQEESSSEKEFADKTISETKVEISVSEDHDKEKTRKKYVRGKNYVTAKAKIDPAKMYKIGDAINVIKSLSYAKFDETYELHIVVKKQGLDLNITLPHSFGKSKKVEVANEATLEKLKSGKIDFDILLATAEMMSKLVMFAKLLGPKGLMPNPKNGTLIKSEKDAQSFSVDQKTIKTEKEQPLIHTSVGKLSMNEKQIEENIQAVITAISKPQIVRVYFKSSMSPSVKLQI